MSNRFPSREIVEQLRARYPKGTRVELVKMDDPQAPPIGEPPVRVQHGLKDVPAFLEAHAQLARQLVRVGAVGHQVQAVARHP